MLGGTTSVTGYSDQLATPSQLWSITAYTQSDANQQHSADKQNAWPTWKGIGTLGVIEAIQSTICGRARRLIACPFRSIRRRQFSS